MIDYATLKLIWWGFIFALFTLFFIFGGRDFGACILLPWIGKNDAERRLVINSIGTTWDGNQVWFITGAGATFAAWPMVYATGFSGLYVALIIVLFSLILRPPGFDFRSKLPYPKWRQGWDWALFLSGFIPAVIFGVALGNLFHGLPYHFDRNMQSFFEGGFFSLINPLGLIFGAASLFILTLQGGLFLQHKLPDKIADRARRFNQISGILYIVLFAVLGWFLAERVAGFSITSMPDKGTAFLPLAKTVAIMPKAWLVNYQTMPMLWGFPITALFMITGAFLCACVRLAGVGLILNSIAIFCSLATAAIALFPFILPSSTHPGHSLTVWDATSSRLTLNYMFYAAVFFLPIIWCYTFWAFHVFRGKVTEVNAISSPEAY